MILCLDSCIFGVGNGEVNYTYFINGTWSIQRDCSSSQLFVQCVNGSWSDNFVCINEDSNGSNGKRQLI